MPRPKPDAFLLACPSRALFSRIAEKWTLLAIAALEDAPLRFGVLRRRLEGISAKMLSQTLRNLEREGLVRRSVLATRPLAVDYALTPLGRELAQEVRALKAWSERRFARVDAAQARYDARHA